ncbi:murein biosynthesis integral membrane protein MurJ [Acidobacteriota bacterium]
MTDMEKQIIKFTGISGFFILLSRIAGYFRDRCIAHFIGTGLEADAFFLAYRIPNLLRRLTAEGAMTVAFVPVFTRLKEKNTPEELWNFASRFLFSLILLTAIIAALGSAGAPLILEIFGQGFHEVPGKFELAVTLLRIMFPYIMLVSAAAVLMGVLNSLKVFGIPASTTIFFNLAVMACLLVLAATSWSDSTGTQGYAVAASIGVVIGGLFQFSVQVPACLKRGMSFKARSGFRHPPVKEVYGKMLPGMAGAGVVQIKALIGSAIASFLPGGVSSIFFAERLMELTLGIFTISMATVILPFMSKSAINRNMEEFKATLALSIRHILFVIVPASAGLALLAKPIVTVLFMSGRFNALSVDYTVSALCGYTIGMLAFSLVRVGAQAFYSFQDVKTPVIIAGVSVLMAVILMLILLSPLEHAGIALGASVASYFNVAVLFIVLRKRFGNLGLSAAKRSAIITIVATCAMSLAVAALMEMTGLEAIGSKLLQAVFLFGIIVAGVAIYVAVCWIFRSEELSFYLRLLRLKSG